METQEDIGGTEADIETLNALGPYNHGTWGDAQRRLGAEEALEGRAEHIVQTFVSAMRAEFSSEQIAGMTMVDVGCYDGFLSVEIEKRLKFRRMVGVEPRKKNLMKGRAARRYCGITTRVEFLQGDIQSLADSGDQFDIVFCSGVMHHLENIDWAIKALKKVCRTAVFIESQVYYSPSESVFRPVYDWFNRRVIEPKDLIYRFVRKKCSVSGFKFETSYTDGSADGFCLVTVPSPETIQMTLEANGFAGVQVLSMGRHYRAAIRSRLRDFSAACLFARTGDQEGVSTQISNYIVAFETYLTLTPLSARMNALLSRLHRERSTTLDKIVLRLLGSQAPFVFKYLLRPVLALFCENPEQREILGSVKFAPRDKLAFEIGKMCYHAGDYGVACGVLRGIVGRVNADWRASYRSFALLALIYGKLGDLDLKKKYVELCLLANAEYPIEEIMKNQH